MPISPEVVEALERKRRDIRRSEERMDYFERQMTERPRLLGIWRYWFHWYRVRRAEWLTRLWLEELREWKREILEDLPDLADEDKLERSRVIEGNVHVIEDGITVILTELRDTEREARAREWRIRFPRPYPTMIRWLVGVRGRIGPIRRWIREVLNELPARWKSFVYVIYYAYTAPGKERHLEAHLEGQCHRTKEVQDKVKELANKLLVQWVQKPIVTVKGVEKPGGYGVPLTEPPGILGPPYEGVFREGYAEWEWGVQWEASVEEGVIAYEVPPAVETKETVTLEFEVYDYDYNTVRMYQTYDVPARWWEEEQEDLEKMVEVGVFLAREFREEEEGEEE